MSHVHAAVDRDHLAGDVTGLRAGEEYDRCGNFLGTAEPTWASVSTVARPMPREPPVTSAILSFSNSCGADVSTMDSGNALR